MSPRETLASLLLAHPFGDDQPLLHTVDRQMTAGEARAGARDVAARLAAAGVGPGEAVAVRMANGPELVVTMFGLWLAGTVLVPVNPRSAPDEVARVLEATGATALIDAGRGAPAEPVPLDRPPRPYPDDAAFVLFTSGTTGAPKAVVHTHHGYLELLDRVLGSLRGPSGGGGAARAPSPNLIPVSLSLNAGIYNALFGLRAGAPLVIMDGFDPATFATLVRRFAIRSTVLPPAAITMVCDDPALTDLGPLRYVRSITAPLSPAVARRLRDRFGVFVLNSYGQAEIGEVVGWTAADARAHPEKLGAAGRPHPGVAVRVVDPAADGRAALPAGEVGELAVRPPEMAAGYATGEGLGDRLTADGYVRTGDLARIDGDGFVWIEGRLGDVINRGGNKVFPQEVEDVLLGDPSVAQAAVVGVPDDRLGEIPVAFVVTRGGAGPVPDDLAARCRAHLTPYKVPVAFVGVDALPRNEAGKVLRRALQERYAAGAGSR